MDAVREVTVWRSGEAAEVVAWDSGVDPSRGVLWIDLESSASTERAAAASHGAVPRSDQGDARGPAHARTTSPRARATTRAGSSSPRPSRSRPAAWRSKQERGKAMRSGVLIFQPVELLAGDGWLLTCWHPTRTFAGAEKLPDDGSAWPPATRSAKRSAGNGPSSTSRAAAISAC